MTDSPTPAPKKLTAKQRRFVDEYITHNLNATKAALAAGYSEATAYSQGSRLLKNVEIRAAIEGHLAVAGMRAQEVLLRLTEHARADIGDLWDETLGGINWATARRKGLTRLIKKIKRKTTYRTVGDETIETVEEDFELYDAQHALELLGKHHGLFVEKVEHTGIGGGPIKTYVTWSPDDWDTPNP